MVRASFSRNPFPRKNEVSQSTVYFIVVLNIRILVELTYSSITSILLDSPTPLQALLNTELINPEFMRSELGILAHFLQLLFLPYSSVNFSSATEIGKCRGIIEVNTGNTFSVLSGVSGHSLYSLTIREHKGNGSIPFEVIGHLGQYAEIYLVDGSSSESLVFRLKQRGLKDRGNLVRNALNSAVERWTRTEIKFENFLNVLDLSITDIGLNGIFRLTESEFISFFNVLIKELQIVFPTLEVQLMESEDSIVSKKVQSMQATLDHNYQVLRPRNEILDNPSYQAVFNQRYRRVWDDGTAERVSEVMSIRNHQFYELRISRWPGQNHAYAETIAYVDANDVGYWDLESKMWVNRLGHNRPDILKIPSNGGNRLEIYKSPLDGENLRISWIKIDFKWQQFIFRDVWRLSVVKADGSSVHNYFAPGIGLIRQEQYSPKGKLVRQKQLMGTE